MRIGTMTLGVSDSMDKPYFPFERTPTVSKIDGDNKLYFPAIQTR
jgi:hypothetical protein